MRVEEEWARSIIEPAVGSSLVERDCQGGADQVHDYDFTTLAGERAAVEVTSATLGPAQAVANLPGLKDVNDARLAFAWIVFVLPDAPRNRLRTGIPDLLVDAEQAGVGSFSPEAMSVTDPLRQRAVELRVGSASSIGEGLPPGSISVGHLVPNVARGPTGPDAIPVWLDEFLHHPTQQDNLKKLWNSDAHERHLFLIVRMNTTAPPGVAISLMNPQQLPTVDPDLPDEITHVWTVSEWPAEWGIRWSPRERWSLFRRTPSPWEGNPRMTRPWSADAF